MGKWSCTEPDEGFVDAWIPTLLREGWPAVRRAFERAANEDPENPTLETITISLAAAIVVGAARGRVDNEMPNRVKSWVDTHRSTLDAKLVPMALEAVDRCIDYYADIWGEGDESFGCQSSASDLRAALGGIEEPEPDAPER